MLNRTINCQVDILCQNLCFMNLMKRSETEEGEIRVNNELREMGMYVKDLIQISFGFLVEMMHLAATATQNSSILSQIC